MSDWIELVESAYHLEGDAAAWLVRLHASPPEGGRLSTRIYADHPGAAEHVRAVSGGLAGDALAILAPTGTGRGAVLVAPLRDPRPATTEREQRLFARIAAHLGAGLRLRLVLASAGEGLESEAILDGSARLHHAEGAAVPPGAREVLREAVVRRERARTRDGRGEAEHALALWEGLVAGRWSLVDRFERDGRRFVVAHRNDPDVGDPRGLTRRERQVAEYVGLGWSAKEIAYTFGISQAAVSNAARGAMTKLAIASRAELATFFSPLGLRARLVEFEVAGEALAAAALPLLDAARAAALSDAERDVALDLMRGATVGAIAARRGRSPLTVETQIRAIYGKLGVGSRVELAARLADA